MFKWKQNKTSDILEIYNKAVNKIIEAHDRAIEPFIAARQNALRDFRLECNVCIGRIRELESKTEKQTNIDYFEDSKELNMVFQQTLRKLKDICDVAIATTQNKVENLPSS